MPSGRAVFSLQLLGGCLLASHDGPVTGRAAQRRRLAFLALVAAAGGRGVSRDKLLALLWPERDADSARRLLADTLWVLRSALGRDTLLAAGDRVALNEDVIACDVTQFEDALERGDPNAAVAAYAGPFLDGFHLADSVEFERWVDGERDRLEGLHAAALETLAREAELKGDSAVAASWWRMLAAQRAYDSGIARHLVGALVASGDRAGALQHIRVHAAMLRDLDLEVDPEFLELARNLQSVRARTGMESGHPAKPNATPVVSAAPEPLQPASPSQSAAQAPSTSAMPPPVATGRRRAAGRIARLKRIALLAIGPVVIAAGVVLSHARTDPSAASHPGIPYPRTALAVLPFHDLSVDPADGYFAAGLHDELLTQLAKVAALSLRGRASVTAYAGTTKPVRQIAEELRVGALVDGSVQVVDGRLRVNVKLVDAATDEHLWAESFDGTLDDAFAIQSDIAQHVVRAVGAALGAHEHHALTEAPTANAEAYRFYLQGREYFHRPGHRRQYWESAQQLFERALALDPDFALAQAALAGVHGWMSWFRYDTSPDRLAAHRAAQKRLCGSRRSCRKRVWPWACGTITDSAISMRRWPSSKSPYRGCRTIPGSSRPSGTPIADSGTGTR